MHPMSNIHSGIHPTMKATAAVVALVIQTSLVHGIVFVLLDTDDRY